MHKLDWILAGLLALVLAPGLILLAETWSRLPYYSHGYLIPVVALWGASTKRRILPLLESGRDGRGGLLLCLSLLGYLAGWLTGIVSLLGVCLVAAIGSGVLFLRGPAWLRTLSFPVGYLLFMVPLPESLLSVVIGRLQLWVSELGTTILQAAGDPVLRQGNVLVLPGGGELFVAEACSGITSLLTLIPLALLLAYFTERSALWRVVLVLTVIPVALLGNLVRVLLTVGVAQRAGVEVATESALHDWVGIGTYVVACLVLLAVGRALRRGRSSEVSA